MVSAALDCLPLHQQSSLAMAEEPNPPPEENVIVARRSEDGFLTFDVRISHIIEQVSKLVKLVIIC